MRSGDSGTTYPHHDDTEEDGEQLKDPNPAHILVLNIEPPLKASTDKAELSCISACSLMALAVAKERRGLTCPEMGMELQHSASTERRE